MTQEQFIHWLKGFTQGIEEYNITPTPTQWNVIKDKLAEVNDGHPIGVGGMGVPNGQPFPRWQEPHTYVYHTGDPIPCVKPNGTAPTPDITFGTSTPGFAVTVNPGYGSITYNPSTSTTYGYPSGSAWHYTSTQQEPTPPKSEKQLLTENHD